MKLMSLTGKMAAFGLALSLFAPFVSTVGGQETKPKLSQEQKKQLKEKLQKMTPEQKAALKAKAKKKYDTLSPEQQEALKQRLKDKKQ